MLTIAQYEYLNRDVLLSGVVDWMVKESPMLNALPMKSVQGNSIKYNVSMVREFHLTDISRVFARHINVY